MADPPDCLLLFTKPDRPGRVKTRLVGAPLPGGAGGTVTPERAAELHAAFLGDLAARLRTGVDRGAFRLRLAWALDPGEPLPAPPPELAGLPGVDAVRQTGDDLGTRLHRALADVARGHRAVAAVGSDHPSLPLARIEEAFAAAAGGRAALGPADDGGYYLIALPAAAVAPELFAGVAWSTGRVLEQTLDRCRAAGLDPVLLAPGRDVDEGPDLTRLAADLARGGSDAPDGLDCPRTRSLLAAWGCLGAGDSRTAGAGGDRAADGVAGGPRRRGAEAGNAERPPRAAAAGSG